MRTVSPIPLFPMEREPVRGAIASELRVRITDYSDASGGDLAVNTWLTLGGWEGPSVNV